LEDLDELRQGGHMLHGDEHLILFRKIPVMHVSRLLISQCNNLALEHETLTISFSLSSNPHKKGVKAPTSIAWDRIDIKWFKILVISPNIVRIHLARSGISMFKSFSTAREKHCSFVIMET
jgi:hypothetical protein